MWRLRSGDLRSPHIRRERIYSFRIKSAQHNMEFHRFYYGTDKCVPYEDGALHP